MAPVRRRARADGALLRPGHHAPGAVVPRSRRRSRLDARSLCGEPGAIGLLRGRPGVCLRHGAARRRDAGRGRVRRQLRRDRPRRTPARARRRRRPAAGNGRRADTARMAGRRFHGSPGRRPSDGCAPVRHSLAVPRDPTRRRRPMAVRRGCVRTQRDALAIPAGGADRVRLRSRRGAHRAELGGHAADLDHVRGADGLGQRFVPAVPRAQRLLAGGGSRHGGRDDGVRPSYGRHRGRRPRGDGGRHAGRLPRAAYRGPVRRRRHPGLERRLGSRGRRGGRRGRLPRCGRRRVRPRSDHADRRREVRARPAAGGRGRGRGRDQCSLRVDGAPGAARAGRLPGGGLSD